MLLRSLRFVLGATVGALSTSAAQSAPLQGLDAYIGKAMVDWKVPGLSIAVVHDDSIVLIKGYGVRTMDATQPVDEHTLFAIGSASKAFTATLAAMMVDEGKMRWDEHATAYLPSFQLYDPYVSRELTLRDLLTHRSGLERGDLVWHATDLDRAEVLRRVRFLKPTWSVRSHFGYQNLMYLAAGQAVAAVSGKSWDDLVRDRIFSPLGMTETNSSVRTLTGVSNLATPHSLIEDTLSTVPWHNIDNIGPAGSINSSAYDMAKWVRFQLAQGKVGGKQLVSPSALAETHTPQQVVPIGADGLQLNPYTHLESYGMGWFLEDYRGRGVDEHGGNIDGMSALVGLVPEEHLGLVVLTNANGSPLPTIVMRRVLDAFFKAPAKDWSADYLKVIAKARTLAKETEQKQLQKRVAGTTPSLSLDKYAGTYADSMYGDANVKMDGGKLVLRFGTTFVGDLEHWNYDTFRAHWHNRALGKDFVTFALDAEGKVASLTSGALGKFARKPEAVDTTSRVALAAEALGNLTGSFESAIPAITVDVQLVNGALKLSVPGQPVYTLVPDSPTRFRLTGPPGMPAGFFLEYELANGAVKSVRLIQPDPRPTLTLVPKKRM